MMEYTSRIVFIFLCLLLELSTNQGIELDVDLDIQGSWDNLTEIRISDRLVFELVIIVPDGSYSLTSSIYGSDGIFTICNVEVVSVGSNFVGIQPTDFTPNITSGNEANGIVLPYAKNNATIDFGTVDNSGADTSNTDFSEIVVLVDVIVVNSSNFLHGSIFYMYATANLDNVLEMDERNFTAIVHDLYSITPPIANVANPGPSLIGDVATWTVTLDLQDAVNKIRVDAWINGTYEYPACDIYVEEFGPAFGCFDKRSAVLSYSSTVTSLTIPTVINTEFNKNLTIANGTYIIIHVLSRVPLFATTSDQLWENIDIYLDDKLVFPLSEPVVLDDTVTLTSPAGTPTVLVDTLGTASTIAIGSGIVFSIDVGTSPGDLAVFNVIISADAALVKVCDVQLMEIGSNLCMSSFVNVTFTSSGSNNFYDGASVLVGSVPNIRPLADPTDPNNKFRLEVAVCLPDDTTAQVGDTLSLGVNVFYDVNVASKKVTRTKTYSVAADTDTSLACDTFYLSGSNNVPGYISDVVSVNFTATFNETTDRFTLNVSVPVLAGTALAFIESVTVMRVGHDLLCMENRTVMVLDNTTVSYSQMHSVKVDIGPVTYAGLLERSPFLNYTTYGMDVNQVIFTVSLVVADHVVNTDGSLIPVTAVLEGATGFSAYSTSFIDVQISGSETPVLQFDFLMEEFSYTEKISGDNVTCSVALMLNAISTAHAQDVVIHIMTPYYIEFGEMYDIEGANVTAIPLVPEPGFDLKIGEIDFKDNISFSFTLILDPTRVMPSGLQNIRTVVPVDMTYTGEIRGDRLNVGVLYSGYIVKEFGFNAESPSVLGMESGSVLDCQIQGSSYQSTNLPYDARLNVGNGWKPVYRGEPFCTHEYLQVNVGSPAYVTSLIVQSTTDNAQDIIPSFQLQYSDDTMAWYDVTQEDNVTPKTFVVTVPGGANINNVYNIDLNETQRFTAQYIRLLSGVCILGIRLELTGVKQSDSPVDCTQITAPASSVPEQSYVINGVTGTMFVCGLTHVGEDVICSRSEDGDMWQEIDDSIAHIVAVVSNTTIVVAETGDISTYLISEDDGYTWYAATDDIVTEIQSLPGYTLSIALPYDDYSSISNNNMYNAHGMLGPNSVKFTGVMEGIAINSGGWAITAWWGTEDWSAL